MITSRKVRSVILIITMLGFSSCKTTKPNAEWKLPEKPVNYPVNFQPLDGGLYLDVTNSLNLLKNVEGMEAYTEKVEALVKEMKKYYGAK